MLSHYYPLLFYVLVLIVFIRLLQSSFIGKLIRGIITTIFILITLYVGYIVFIA